MRYLYNPPLLLRIVFNNFLWTTTNNEILLTFDDGPNPGSTEDLLIFLKSKGIKAMFFCLGENVERYPELFHKIIENGHTVGNHTYSHKKMNEVSQDEIDTEISETNKIVKDKFNYKIKYFRPPHGRFTFRTNKILKQHNLINVMWSLLTWDYKGDFNVVKKSIENYLKKNSIVVLHDSDKTKNILIDSVKLVIEKADKNNFKIGDPENCLK